MARFTANSLHTCYKTVSPVAHARRTGRRRAFHLAQVVCSSTLPEVYGSAEPAGSARAVELIGFAATAEVAVGLVDSATIVEAVAAVGLAKTDPVMAEARPEGSSRL